MTSRSVYLKYKTLCDRRKKNTITKAKGSGISKYIKDGSADSVFTSISFLHQTILIKILENKIKNVYPYTLYNILWIIRIIFE